MSTSNCMQRYAYLNNIHSLQGCIATNRYEATTTCENANSARTKISFSSSLEIITSKRQSVVMYK